MTFTEAAIEVLRREGKPLHFKKIAEIAVRDSLLDHVGKIPEEVMGGQLVTHCRLPHTERKVVVVQAGTFALSEWGLDEDPAGLENLIEVPPEGEIPYRSRERHPTPSREMARSSGRGEARARRREEGEERRGRRFPPPAEVAFEILAGSDHALSLGEIAAQGAERFLMPDAFVRDTAALAAALAEDNRRRESAGRRPLFAVDGDRVSLAAQPEPGERAPAPIAAAARAAVTPGDLRRSALLALRRRIRECDPQTVEHVFARLLEAMEVHELKVAKRGRDHVVYTGRRRMGLGEVRHCIRVLRSGAEPSRRDVGEVRRDVGNYGAQIGVILSAGDAGRDARAEAAAPGQLPVVLLCGDAMAEALADHTIGCRIVMVPELDEGFFRAATDAAQQEEAARRARREDRDRREGREGRDGREGREARDGREGREGREPREAREPREPRDAPRPEREPAATEVAAGATPPAAAPSAGEPPAANQPEPEPLAAAGAAVPEQARAVSGVPAAPLEASLDDEEGDGDEEGEEDEGAEGAEAGPADSAAPVAPGREGERPAEGGGRRRRRRRRRRGGRGRGREGGPAGAAAAAPGAPSDPGGGAAGERAAEPSAAPAARDAAPSPKGEGGE